MGEGQRSRPRLGGDQGRPATSRRYKIKSESRPHATAVDTIRRSARDLLRAQPQLRTAAARGCAQLPERQECQGWAARLAVALLDRAYGSKPKYKVSLESDAPLMFTTIRQVIISPSGEEKVIPPIFGDSLDSEDAEVVE